MGRPRARPDTRAFFKKPVAAGIPRQQADAYVCPFVRLIRQRVVSDKHLDELLQTAQSEFRFDICAAAGQLVAQAFPNGEPKYWCVRSSS